jgi:hypothetical protein
MFELPLSAAEWSKDPIAQWALPIVAVLTILYVVVVRPMRQKKDPMEAKPPAVSHLAQQRALERDMTNVLVQYEQMIRQMTAGVDTRAARLESLIHEADQRIATLRRLNAAGAERPPVVDRMSADAPTPLDSPAAPSTDVVAAPDLEDWVDPRHAEIYALADAGQSSRDIARQVDRAGAEIEMILALRPRPRRPAEAPLG